VADVKFRDGSQPCLQWLSDFQMSNTVGLVVSFSLSFINAVLRISLRSTSKFEGHHTVSEQLGSAFSKMWIVQFINTAALLLLVNNRLQD